MASNQTILITGGAGFIGAHLAEELLRHGYQVRALDNLSPQVHEQRQRPGYLNSEVELIIGDVRDAAVVRRALADVRAVFHFAAAVGVGQSMYRIAHYTECNNLGTAVLLEQLIQHPVERLIVASSMSIYGEGLYRHPSGTAWVVGERGGALLDRGHWVGRGADGAVLAPVPTPETKLPMPSSVYALSKYDQERLCHVVGQAYDIPTVALRFFNAYGPYQALSNPYTGVLAIFATRYLMGQPPIVFEDGMQQRDFVHVRDLAAGCRLALESPQAAGESFNLGSGRPRTILEVARAMARVLDCRHIEPEVAQRCRAGDIRHCFADISKARRTLGFEPKVSFEAGLEELAEWLTEQLEYTTDRTEQASQELLSRGLVV